MVKKTCPNCNKEFDAKRNRIVYCSNTCANQHHARKVKELKGSLGQTVLNLESNEPKPTPQKEKVVVSDIPKRAERMTLPGSTDVHTQFVINMLYKEVDRFEDSAKEYKGKAEKLQSENEKLRDELAKIKTDQQIADIQAANAKPSGLSGLIDQAKGLLDNQYLGPVAADLLRGFLTGGMPSIAQAQHISGGGDAETIEVLQWFGTQEKTVQDNFKALVQALIALPDQTRVPDLLVRLVNVIKQGSSITRSSSSASMSYGT